jgi:predicted sugar kinase
MEISERSGEFYIEVDNPWAGSTETGFGYTCHASLNIGHATLLRDWLTERLDAIAMETRRAIDSEAGVAAKP